MKIFFGEIRRQPYDAGIYSLVPADDRKLKSYTGNAFSSKPNSRLVN
jgi:hypothetical protein